MTLIAHKTFTRFLIVWLTYWIIFLFQPVNLVYGNFTEAFLYQLLFLITVLISGIFSYSFIRIPYKKFSYDINSNIHFKLRRNQFLKIAKIGMWLSAIGLFLQLIDKVSIQGLDYTNGIAEARYQWRESSALRGQSYSSLYSVLGYLIGHCYYLSVSLIIILGNEISVRKKTIYVSIGIFYVLINSAILGGRSGILFGLAFWSYAFFAGQTRGLLSTFKGKQFFLKMFLILILITYVLYIFFDRAQANGTDVALYGENFLPYLGFQLAMTPNYDSLLYDFLITLNLAFSYITHSIASVAVIIDSTNPIGTAWGNHFISLAYKIGFIENLPSEWILRGRFPSLPGAFLYTGGIIYLLFFSLILKRRYVRPELGPI